MFKTPTSVFNRVTSDKVCVSRYESAELHITVCCRVDSGNNVASLGLNPFCLTWMKVVLTFFL